MQEILCLEGEFMRKLLLAMMAGSLLVHPARAQVGGGLVFCTNCATEPTQVSVKLMHDLEYAKQLLQYAIQVQQLADALKKDVLQIGNPEQKQGILFWLKPFNYGLSSD